MYCPQCSAQLEDSTKSCPQCGTPISGKSSPSQETPTQVPRLGVHWSKSV